jgi:hypothetical protein
VLSPTNENTNAHDLYDQTKSNSSSRDVFVRLGDELVCIGNGTEYTNKTAKADQIVTTSKHLIYTQSP